MPGRRVEESGIFPAPALVRRRRAIVRRGLEQGRYSETFAEVACSLARLPNGGSDDASWSKYLDAVAEQIDRVDAMFLAERRAFTAKRGDDDQA